MYRHIKRRWEDGINKPGRYTALTVLNTELPVPRIFRRVTSRIELTTHGLSLAVDRHDRTVLRLCVRYLKEPKDDDSGGKCSNAQPGLNMQAKKDGRGIHEANEQILVVRLKSATSTSKSCIPQARKDGTGDPSAYQTMRQRFGKGYLHRV
jgi:hypothetical protein